MSDGKLSRRCGLQVQGQLRENRDEDKCSFKWRGNSTAVGQGIRKLPSLWGNKSPDPFT